MGEHEVTVRKVEGKKLAAEGNDERETKEVIEIEWTADANPV